MNGDNIRKWISLNPEAVTNYTIINTKDTDNKDNNMDEIQDTGVINNMLPKRGRNIILNLCVKQFDSEDRNVKNSRKWQK